MTHLSSIQGIIDVPKEIGKLNGKKERLSGQLQKLKDASAKDDYTTKVPEEVRQQNSQKVSNETEICVVHLCIYN